ncbi:MAG: hypothetical protein AUI10_03455 [Actinobacteria bacterium 13_2_20CM_2_72_6]|nr:MAG: hypothetical protein AUI10_03455 [Actinobacteria bacterium 13_2_20CM_2_72_6]
MTHWPAFVAGPLPATSVVTFRSVSVPLGFATTGLVPSAASIPAGTGGTEAGDGEQAAADAVADADADADEEAVGVLLLPPLKNHTAPPTRAIAASAATPAMAYWRRRLTAARRAAAACLLRRFVSRRICADVSRRGPWSLTKRSPWRYGVRLATVGRISCRPQRLGGGCPANLPETVEGPAPAA